MEQDENVPEPRGTLKERSLLNMTPKASRIRDCIWLRQSKQTLQLQERGWPRPWCTEFK